MKNGTTENSNITVTEAKNAKIRSKAPAAIAVAACAVVAIFGAVQLSHNGIRSGGVAENCVTTDGEDMLAENSKAAKNADLCEKVKIDSSLEYIPMSLQGTVNSGFEGVEVRSGLWIYDVGSSILIVVSAERDEVVDMTTWDAPYDRQESGELSDNCNLRASGSLWVNGTEYKCNKINMQTCVEPRWRAMGFYQIPAEALKDISEDAKFKLVINELHSLDEDGNEDGFFDAEGEYVAEFTYNDILTYEGPDHDDEIEPVAHGEVDIVAASEQDIRHLEYTVNTFHYDETGIYVGLTFDLGAEGVALEDLTSTIFSDMNINSEEYRPYRIPEDVDVPAFINIEYKDGSIKPYDCSSESHMVEMGENYVEFQFLAGKLATDFDDVKAIHIGTAVIPLY